MRTLPTIGQAPRIAAVEQLADELLQALRSVECSGPLQEGVRTCPACYCGPDEGHDSGCRIGMALRRAAELGVG